MTHEDIREKMKEVFRAVFKNPTLEIPDQIDSSCIKGWDSLNHINLIVGIERSFTIKFAASELIGLRNVGDTIALIHEKLTDS